MGAGGLEDDQIGAVAVDLQAAGHGGDGEQIAAAVFHDVYHILGGGDLRAGALEESNVDLTAELVNMMTAQRTYQANAQTIKTQDQVMSTLVNLR